MSKPTEVNGGFTNEAFESLTAEANQLREETARLRARLREAEENTKRLEAEKAAIAAERDGYVKSLHALLHEDWTFTAEEIADLEMNGVEFTKEFIDELERDLRAMEPRNG